MCALDDLLSYFIPAVFVVGWMVRDCYWLHRTRGTGVHARRTLEYVYCLLLQLQESLGRASEYLRSIGAALLSWTTWHDDTSAHLYVEEANEASLSRLASVCLRATRAVTVDQVSDLYVNLGPPRQGVHAVSDHPVSDVLLRRVTENVRLVLNAKADHLPWTQWRNARLLHSVRGWPNPVPAFPRADFDVTDTLVRDTLHRTLRRMRGGQPLPHVVEQFLNENVPLTRTSESNADIPPPTNQHQRLRNNEHTVSTNHPPSILSAVPMRTVFEMGVPHPGIRTLNAHVAAVTPDNALVGIPADPDAD